jgi:IS5 family transposase
MKKVAATAGEAGARFRDRSPSAKRRILEIAFASRQKRKRQRKMQAAYRKLLEATSRVVGQAKKVSGEIAIQLQQDVQLVLQKSKQ